jgi:tetratricopeptide (TPR) repeat protein
MSSTSDTLQRPDDIDDRIAAAEDAAGRRDWPLAVHLWQAALDLAPRNPEPFLGAVAALRGAGYQDDAERLLGDVAGRFPWSRHVATAYAASAHARADWPAAVDRWAGMQDAFPDYPFAFLQGAQALREAGRLDEAETLLEMATQRFPDDEALAMAQAWLANARRDWPSAVQRWAHMRERFPENPAVFMGGVWGLHSAGRHDEIAPLLDQAEGVLDAAIDRGFDQAAANRMKFDIARLRMDWPAVRLFAERLIADDPATPAATRLALAQANRHLADRDSAAALAGKDLHADAMSSSAGLAENPFALLRVAQTLREAGRLDEAEALLETATQRFADDEALAMAQAWLANARRDWPTAVQRWARMRDRFPENPAVFMGGIWALRNAGRPNEISPLLDQAEVALDAAIERGFDQAAANRMKLEIARLRLDWPAVHLFAGRLLADDPSPPAATLLALAQANWHLGDRDAADAIASRALEADATLADAVLVRAWVAADRGDSAASLALYRRLAELSRIPSAGR